MEGSESEGSLALSPVLEASWTSRDVRMKMQMELDAQALSRFCGGRAVGGNDAFGVGDAGDLFELFALLGELLAFAIEPADEVDSLEEHCAFGAGAASGTAASSSALAALAYAVGTRLFRLLRRLLAADGEHVDNVVNVGSVVQTLVFHSRAKAGRQAECTCAKVASVVEQDHEVFEALSDVVAPSLFGENVVLSFFGFGQQLSLAASIAIRLH
ncbi:hypothetical protein L1887_58732 [Cichorium endivia]|nr:hypothetical protein L1887_58732 [Cichorium endivia]